MTSNKQVDHIALIKMLHYDVYIMTSKSYIQCLHTSCTKDAVIVMYGTITVNISKIGQPLCLTPLIKTRDVGSIIHCKSIIRYAWAGHILRMLPS